AERPVTSSSPSGRPFQETRSSSPLHPGVFDLTLIIPIIWESSSIVYNGQGRGHIMDNNVPPADQTDRAAPINLRQSGPTPVAILLDTRVRESPQGQLSMQARCC